MNTKNSRKGGHTTRAFHIGLHQTLVQKGKGHVPEMPPPDPIHL